MEIAARFTGATPEKTADGGAHFGDRIIRSAHNGGLLVNFDGGAGGIPHYSFADVIACINAGRTDFLRDAFAGKVVLIGAVLDVEDRKLTSKRFATARDGASDASRCILPPLTDLYRLDLARSVIPGVEIQASAVRDMITGEWLSTPSPFARFAALLLVAALCAAAGLAWTARMATPVIALAIVACAAGGALALRALWCFQR